MSTKIKFNHNVATKLIAYLPFDTSTTEDLCGNTWTTSGTPTIANGALKLDGNSSYLAMDGGITLGGQDFTIRGKFNMSSSTGSYPRILQIFNTANSNIDAICIARQETSSNLRVYVFDTYQTTAITLGRDYDFELNYSRDEYKVRFFLDGVLKITLTQAIARTTFANFYLGRSNYSDNAYFVGTLDEFMIFDGVALHTENFTPSIDVDYIESVIVTEEIPLLEGKPAGKPAGKRLAIYHNGKTYYALLVAPDDKTASAFHLTYGGTTYALRPVKYFDVDAQYCTVYLPFDTSATEDLCGNTWTTKSGDPTIITDNAISGKALTGGQITLTTPIMLGGQDFTVDFWFKAFTKNWQAVYIWRNGESLNAGSGGLFGIERHSNGGMNVYVAAGASTGVWISSSSSMAHYAFVYQHSAKTMKVYRNGIRVVTKTGVTINRKAHTALIGHSTLFAADEFRVFDGVALWTDNFTPPTVADYDDFTLAINSGSKSSGSKSKSSSKQSAVIEEPEEDIQGGVSTSTDLLNESISGNSSISPAVAFAYSNAYALWGLSLPTTLRSDSP